MNCSCAVSPCRAPSSGPLPLQRDHGHGEYLPGEVPLDLLVHHGEPGKVRDRAYVGQRPSLARVLAIGHERHVVADVVLYHHHPPLPEGVAAPPQELHQVGVAEVSDHPLHPNQVVRVRRRLEVLETGAEESATRRDGPAEVRRRLRQHLPRCLDEVAPRHPQRRQQEPLRDTPDARSALARDGRPPPVLLRRQPEFRPYPALDVPDEPRASLEVGARDPREPPQHPVDGRVDPPLVVAVSAAVPPVPVGVPLGPVRY
mmetsp:Transcript_9085/g.21099  ORF Transcript_9085/g.21099 Transcript_9085/m.21099 type:complete len:258 (-) Transcript_9085:162-935(-)